MAPDEGAGRVDRRAFLKVAGAGTAGDHDGAADGRRRLGLDCQLGPTHCSRVFAIAGASWAVPIQQSHGLKPLRSL